MKFLYLIQSQHNYHEWLQYQTTDRTFVLGVWGQNCLNDQINLSGTTWASGRNKLIKLINFSKYDYVTLCDDDLSFKNGNFDDYEHFLKIYTPNLCHPIVTNRPRWGGHVKNNEKCNFTYWNTDNVDGCFTTIKSDLISQILPYDTTFDKTSWTISTFLLNVKVKNLGLFWTIPKHITMNNIERRKYPKSFDYNRIPKKITNYCKQKFSINYKCLEDVFVEGADH